VEIFEWIIAMLLGAAVLAVLAKKIGAPYPTLLALGGVALAFIPGSPRWTLDPELALTLFVAPVLLDAAYDTSLRDLRSNWRPVAGLVVAAVGTTVIAVAFAARWLIPGLPWPVAIALGAIVAPPDAAAATAVMRQVKLPHRLLKILEGESLLNDASALLVYRLAIASAITGSFSIGSVAPTFLLTVFGSLAAGIGAAFALRPLINGVDDVPVSVILQFASTFGVWIAAEAIGLSGILTLVAFAMTMARYSGPALPARMRVPVFAVWEIVVFVLNAFAFVLIGLQLRPVWERLGGGDARMHALLVAGAVLLVTVAARFAWVLSYTAIKRHLQDRRRGAQADKPSFGGGVVVAWAGMRGIVTLAAAFAIPVSLQDGTPFPHRDLILLCAFAVVLGTLVLQGLTIKPLIAWLGLTDDDPVGQELRVGRARAYQAVLDDLQGKTTLTAHILREEYTDMLDRNNKRDKSTGRDEDVAGGPLRRRAITLARDQVTALRDTDVIGDDAYRILVKELDWAELSAGGDREKGH
jgi:Na+/H+ antiporter